ncbi:MAG: copper resistance protein B [Bradyrhizobium sp.]|jgi:copper resistance protein B|uniref:copper resistance protein B n=1 Tax=Bradyrhizobium sp. TaxID=376 RepID=UPI001A28784C|nr:copper resistance protein B [Bradyrhizobium sp.]MBJ7402151.1 copper resistance protein B [Bradyrhizobium sp.]
MNRARPIALIALVLGSISLSAPAQAQSPVPYVEQTSWWGSRTPNGISFPDQQLFSASRFEKLEWSGPNSARWDMEGYIGGDYDRLVFKSEGLYSGRTKNLEEGQLQVLYSRLIDYYFNAQVGVRQDFSNRSNRTYAVIGLQGLAPGFIETDTDLYISQEGEVSASFTAFYDLLITNRLILQPRIDLRLQAQPVPDLELGSGLTDFELGARLRYEFTRNFAPYIGVNWDRKVGQTATIARNSGEPVSAVSFVAGVRLFW